LSKHQRTVTVAESLLDIPFSFLTTPHTYPDQGGITCGAIDEPRKSSKAIDERVIINFRDKNVVIARFRDKNVVIARFRNKNVLSIAFLFYKYGKYI